MTANSADWNQTAVERCLRGPYDDAVPVPRGDHDLNPDLHPGRTLRQAAVLVAFRMGTAGPSIILTRRSERLTEHAGQISFPGGRRDPSDRDDVATALREAQEEIGLDAMHVKMLGRLDTYVTRTGFTITPCVGWVQSDFQPRPHPREVAEVFDVPLAFILAPRALQCHDREIEGRVRRFYAFVYGEHYIWGATAGMLRNLREALLASPVGRAGTFSASNPP